MRKLNIKFALFVNYFLFGLILNSVGIVILQVQNFYKVSESAASVLEPFKDITIAIVSFIIASYIIKIGYRRAMLIALALVSAACFILPAVKTFIAVKLLFAIAGAGFALMKISVFGSIGLITKNDKEHISLMNFVESIFMIGVLSCYFIFSAFIDDKNIDSDKWFNVYYFIGSLFVAAFFVTLFSSLNESRASEEANTESKAEFIEMLKLAALPAVVSFIVCAFLYVLIEQSIMSWLPTFNYKVLHLPSSFSVILAGIMSASTAIGRFGAGFVMKKFSWINVLIICLFLSACLVLIALPMAKDVSPVPAESWSDVPLVAYIFPLIGFFIAPVYPSINSTILASLPKSKHGAMSGLIVVFSALGGSLGSLITGYIFKNYGGESAFYFSLIPVTLLIIALIVYKRKLTTK